MGNRSRILRYGLLAFPVIALASLLPTGVKSALHTQGVVHPWLHLAVFGLVGFMLMLGTQSPKIRIVLFVATISFGWATELLEHFINSSPLESSDIFADTVGAFLGLLAAVFWGK